MITLVQQASRRQSLLGCQPARFRRLSCWTSEVSSSALQHSTAVCRCATTELTGCCRNALCRVFQKGEAAARG